MINDTYKYTEWKNSVHIESTTTCTIKFSLIKVLGLSWDTLWHWYVH